MTSIIKTTYRCHTCELIDGSVELAISKSELDELEKYVNGIVNCIIKTGRFIQYGDDIELSDKHFQWIVATSQLGVKLTA